MKAYQEKLIRKEFSNVLCECVETLERHGVEVEVSRYNNGKNTLIDLTFSSGRGLNLSDEDIDDSYFKTVADIKACAYFAANHSSERG